MIKLINSAMMPAPGTYKMRALSKHEFAATLQDNPFESFVGYQDTADFIERISGVKVAVSRNQTTVADGDLLLIVRLKYRISNPGDKSKYTPLDSDYEFFDCEYSS